MCRRFKGKYDGKSKRREKQTACQYTIAVDVWRVCNTMKYLGVMLFWFISVPTRTNFFFSLRKLVKNSCMNHWHTSSMNLYHKESCTHQTYASRIPNKWKLWVDPFRLNQKLLLKPLNNCLWYFKVENFASVFIWCCFLKPQSFLKLYYYDLCFTCNFLTCFSFLFCESDPQKILLFKFKWILVCLLVVFGWISLQSSCKWC